MGDLTCLRPDCEEPPTRSGLGNCAYHFWEARKNGSIPKRKLQTTDVCTYAGCDRVGYAVDWCQRHYVRWWKCGVPQRESATDIFWRHVDRNAQGGCWLWTGYVLPNGYGVFRLGGFSPRGETYAHRAAYDAIVGSIPSGRHIDHTCHGRDPSCRAGDDCLHRRCVNPEHLEVVTPKENSRRINRIPKTHCKRNHEYTDRTETGELIRVCRVCKKLNMAAWHARNRQGESKAA